MKVKWHHSATLAGNPTGRTHYDIGGDDCSNVALVYPSEDGDEDTLRKARLIANAPELFEFAQNIFNGLEAGMITLSSPADETLANVLGRGRKALDLVKAQPNAYHRPPIRPCPVDLRRSRRAVER